MSRSRPTVAELATEIGVNPERARDYLRDPPADLTPWVRKAIAAWRAAGGTDDNDRGMRGPRWTPSHRWERRAAGTDRR